MKLHFPPSGLLNGKRPLPTGVFLLWGALFATSSAPRSRRNGSVKRLRESHPTTSLNLNVKQPLPFGHASSPLLFAARGRRRLLHSRPLVRGRAERRVPVAPLGLMPNAVFRNCECIRTFGGAEQVPDVPHTVFFQPACTLPWRTVRSPK